MLLYVGSIILKKNYTKKDYYVVKNRKRERIVASLNLSSVLNARDLGDYYTKDGIKIKSGTLIRSGHLDKISSEDKDILKTYNITDIVDFRSEEEITCKNKLDWTNEHIIDIIDRSKIENNKLVFIDWSKMEDINEFTQFIKLFNLDTNDRYVKTITSEFGKSQYKKFFDVLLEAKGSVLFHCVCGKDRTGIAATLLLGILDVNDKDIIYDFLLTNEYNKKNIETVKQYFETKTDDEDIIEMATVFFEGVSKDHIENLINYINNNYGSIKNFCIKELQLNENDIKILKNKYLVN